MAKFQEIESAVVSLDKQVKILTTDLQKLITTVNSQSKSQTDLAEKTKAVTKATNQISETEKQRLKLLDKLKVANSDSIQKNEEIKVQLQKQNKANKELAREKLKLVGAYEKESKTLIGLRTKYKNAAVQYGVNSKQALKLRDSVVKLDSKLKQVDKSVGQSQRNVGNYTKQTGKLKGAIKNLGTQVLSLGAAYLGLQGAVKVFKKIGEAVKNNSQNVADALDRMKAKFNATFDAIGRAIANMDLSSLAADIRDARAAAEEYTLAQDELGDTMRSIEIDTAKVRNAVFKLREVYTNTGAEATKRLEAVQKANKLLLELQERRSKVANEAIQAELNLVAGTLKLNEEEKKLFSSFIEDYGKKEGAYFDFQQKNIPLLEQRAALEKEISEGTEVVRSQGGVGVIRTQEAIAAQKELNQLNETGLASYNRLGEAVDSVGDAQRQRITDSIIALESQEEKTQKLINETARQESTIRISAKKTTEIVGKEEEERTKIAIDEQLERIGIKGLEVESEEELQGALINSWRKYYDDKRAARESDDEDSKLSREEQLELASESFDFIGNASQELFDLQNSLADSEISNLERQRDAEVAAAEKAGKDTSKIEEKYAKKEAKLRTEQAKKEKQQSLFTIGIKTAQAIVAAAAIGPPQNIPFIAFAAALGAVQLAAVAATPIPKFKHGTDGQLQLDTTAIVGDGGKPELVTTPQGSFISPAKDTMVHLPRGSQVFGGDSPETQAALSGGMSDAHYNGLIASNNRIEKAIQNQKQAPYWTRKGLKYRDEASNTDILRIKNTMR